MISKYELIGIFGSVALMAVALLLLRVESTTVDNLTRTDNSQLATAVVSGDNDQQAIFNALVDSVDTNGNLNKLVIDDVTIGTGEEVVDGDKVIVNYIGRLESGQEFDNSYNRGEAFKFTVGDGKVIAGWEEGLKGMKVGGKRILVIPPAMAYGSSKVGPIPANSTLIFAVELLSINE